VRSLQQRVCPGFSPDSLLRAFYGSPNFGKDRKLLLYLVINKMIYNIIYPEALKMLLNKEIILGQQNKNDSWHHSLHSM